MPFASATASGKAPHAFASTMGYYAAFLAMGLAAASLGPTLPGLAEQIGVPLKQIGLLFTARALGYLLGSMLSGYAYDRFSGHLLMVAALLGMATGLGLAPLIIRPGLLLVVMGILGMGEGILDVGGNTLLLWLHGSQVAPYMNGLHFFFGVGTFVAPVIIAQAALWGGGLLWAYWILALLTVPAALWLWRLPSPRLLHPAVSHRDEPLPQRLILLIALFLLLYVAVELGFGGWVFTYAVAAGVANETVAAYLTSAYWGAFTLGRLLTIPLTTRWRPQTLLLLSLLGGLLSLLVCATGRQSAVLTWTGSIGLGLSLAAVFPAILIWAERRMTMSSKVTCWFFISVSVGGMLFPWLIGELFAVYGAPVIIQMLFMTLAASLAALLTLLAIARPLKRSLS